MWLLAFSENSCLLEVRPELVTDIILQFELTFFCLQTFLVFCCFFIEKMILFIPPLSIDDLPSFECPVKTAEIDIGHFSDIFTVINPYFILHVCFCLQYPETYHDT